MQQQSIHVHRATLRRVIAALGLLVLALVGALPAVAVELDGAVTAVNIVQDETGPYERFQVDVEWSVPDDATSDDWFLLTLPDEVEVRNLAFDLPDADGNVVAVGTLTDGLLRIDLEPFVDVRDNVSGSAFFEARWDADLITPGTTTSVTFTSGSQEFVDEVQIRVGQLNRGATKWMNTDPGPPEVLRWGVVSPTLTPAMIGQQITLSDIADPANPIECSDPAPTLRSGYYRPLFGASRPEGPVPGASVTCTPEQATVTTVITADMVDRPGDYDDEGRVLILSGSSRIPTAGQQVFSNRGEVIIGDQTWPVSVETRRSGGGGIGRGDVRVSVGDHVWFDADHDGIQNDGPSAGIEGVVLTLRRVDTDTGELTPVVDVRGQAVEPTATDASGFYEFTSLPLLQDNQRYVVLLDETTVPTSYLPTLEGGAPGDGDDSSTGAATSVLLQDNGARDPTLDFGFWLPAPEAVSVGDYVWSDEDHDGLQDDAESGIGGVTLTLTGPDGSPVTDVLGDEVVPTQTDADGLYSFDDLPVLAPGESYTVTVTPPDGYEPTLEGGTPGVGDDSSTGSATSVDLVDDGARDPTLDFGFWIPVPVPEAVSVGDYVWFDDNYDGLQGGDESGIGGVTLTLTGPDGSPVTDVLGDEVVPTQTDADGLYSFDDLPVLAPGESYTVTVTPPDGYEPTLEDGTAGVGDDSSTGSATSVDLVDDGARDPTLDFGFWIPAPAQESVGVGDVVWLDGDHDGLQDDAESGIGGVTLTLTGPDGSPVTDVLGDEVVPTQTDADGLYSFDDLPVLAPGESYTVTVTPPDGYEPTLEGGTPGVGDDSSTGSATSVDLVDDGARDPTLDFGFWLPWPRIDIIKADVDGNDANSVGDAVELSDGATDLVFTVTNSGKEALVDVLVSDTVVANGVVEGLSCSFPDGSAGVSWAGPFAIGESFDCTATLSGVEPGEPHEDVAAVTGTGEITGEVVEDDDPYFATTPDLDGPPTVNLPPELPTTGMPLQQLAILAAFLLASGLGLRMRSRRQRGGLDAPAA